MTWFYQQYSYTILSLQYFYPLINSHSLLTTLENHHAIYAKTLDFNWAMFQFGKVSVIPRGSPFSRSMASMASMSQGHQQRILRRRGQQLPLGAQWQQMAAALVPWQLLVPGRDGLAYENLGKIWEKYRKIWKNYGKIMRNHGKHIEKI